MEFLEYPKHVYKGEGEARESRLVLNAEQEEVAARAGYEALPSVPPAPGSPAAISQTVEYLEYPKHVYRGEAPEQTSRLVTTADEEAAAALEGFAPLGAPADGQVHGAASPEPGPAPAAPKADAPVPPKAEKPKAPRKPRAPKPPKA